jgi:serine/threonine protein kinase/Tol biopolymer transport system component
MIGQTIAHYEVTEKIGAGGMGEVYRARDTKLERDVALKVLPESFALDEERLARFDREAKLLAALNHGNIAGIYGTEHWQGRHILVLEYVEGEDLSQRLARGPIPVDEALPIALQIADAVEAAHDQGVIHRDLKPANVKVTPDGTVKVLDFGLAKALDAGDNEDVTTSPTLLASSPTVQGVILGTAAYMSPEQARGKRVDRRADIFAFGCVLYEMLAGTRGFTGDTVSDTLASVLKEQPDMAKLPDDTPPAIRHLLERCLDKNPRQRLRDIGEARIRLDRVIRGEAATPDAALPSTASRTRTIMPYGITALLVIAAVLLTYQMTKSPPQPEGRLRKFRIPVESRGTGPNEPVISPDGSRIAYVLGDELRVQPLDDLHSVTMDAEGVPEKPFWSPDGTQIGYFSEGKIWRVPAAGGASVLVCDPKVGFSGGTGGTWSEDGRIIVGTGASGLLEVPAQGGDEKVFLPLADDEGDHHEPSMLPGDRGVLFIPHRLASAPDQIVLYANGERKVLLEVKDLRLHRPRYSPTGHIMFRRPGANGGVWALPFSLESLEVTGKPFIVAAATTHGSVSSDGTLVYLQGTGEDQYVLRWLARDTTLSEPLSDPGPPRLHPSFSPDGKRVVLAEYADENVDLWIYDLDRRSRTRFTFDAGREWFCVWAPDGKDIYYWQSSLDSIFRKPADGTGKAEAVIDGGMPALSADMKYLVFKRAIKGQQDNLYYMDLETKETATIVATAADEDTPLLSPAGGFLAYDSDESGGWELYVTPFPSGAGKWQVSLGEYSHAAWGADGTTIQYAKMNGDIMEVKFNAGPNGVQLSTPKLLFDAGELSLPSPGYSHFKQSPNDMDRFLVMNPLTTSHREVNTNLTVVENWFREFQEAP